MMKATSHQPWPPCPQASTMNGDTQPLALISTASKSPDMARVTRRSVRCGWFGLVGLIPLIGIFFAAHAVRLHRQVVWELEEPWSGVALRFYSLLGVACMIGYDFVLGAKGSLFVFGSFTALQTFRLWQSFPRSAAPIWNPAGHRLRWGAALGYLGFFNSLAFVVMATWRVITHEWY